MPKKRKAKRKSGPFKKKLRRDAKCIVHSGFKGDSLFTYLDESNDPDKQFENIHKIKELRLAEPAGSSNRMSEVCASIPQQRDENDGYHRSCYQAFTKHVDRLAASKYITTDDAKAKPATSSSTCLKNKI